MYQDTLEISVNTSYNTDEFIEDLKAELEGEIEALMIRSHSDKMTDLEGKLEHEIALERIRVIKEIMERLNLQ